MLKSKYFQIGVFAVLIVLVQVSIMAAGKMPYLTQLTMTAYYSLVIIGLTMLTGYTGQISIGHAGFFAIGGYASAYLTTCDLTKTGGFLPLDLLKKSGIAVAGYDIYGADIISLHPWAACITAVVLAVIVAWMIGKPVLKLKGHYLAMATLGFGTIIYKIVLGSQSLGAADGISDIPAFNLIPGVLTVTGNSDFRIQNYYIAWGLVLLGMLMLLNLINSRVGRAMRSIHGAEDAADSTGVDTAKLKVNVFILSAVFAAVGGVFLTHFNGGIGPSEASIMKSVRYVAIVAIGGMANLWGALFMGVVLNFLSLRGYFGTYDDAVFGAILILIMLFAPDGLLRRELFSRIWLKASSIFSGTGKQK